MWHSTSHGSSGKFHASRCLVYTVTERVSISRFMGDIRISTQHGQLARSPSHPSLGVLNGSGQSVLARRV